MSAAILGGCAASAGAADAPLLRPTPTHTGEVVRSVRTSAARHTPGQEVAIDVELAAFPGASTARLTLWHLAEPVSTAEQRVDLSRETTIHFELTPPHDDFRGYRAEVEIASEAGEIVDRGATAVDVSSSWARFPRYGFLSRFDAGVDARATVDALNEFHVNALQLYDFQWQHHRPFSPEGRWPDIAGREIDGATVRALVDEAHGRNMLAMAYNLINGAYDRYWEDGSGVLLAWGLFREEGGVYDPSQQDRHEPLPAGWATPRIYLFDPASPGWQRHLIAEQRKLFDALPLDGWHVDSLGDRGPLWDWTGRPVNLKDTYAGFLNEARRELGKPVVFNSVGGYGQDEVASGADVDVIYTELWESSGITSYRDLQEVVRRAQARTDRAVVLAAYMNRGKAQSTPDGQTGFFHAPSVLRANAAIFALGASHIELGDEGGMLSTEYFPSQKLQMDPALRDAVRDQYDFLVAYQNLLRDGVTDSSASVAVDGVPTSTSGEADTVWTITRRRPGATLVHLVNLLGSGSDAWRDDLGTQGDVQDRADLAVTVHTGRAVRRAWVAAPDVDHGAPHPVEVQEDGGISRVVIPELHTWSMLVLEE